MYRNGTADIHVHVHVDQFRANCLTMNTIKFATILYGKIVQWPHISAEHKKLLHVHVHVAGNGNGRKPI